MISSGERLELLLNLAWLLAAAGIILAATGSSRCSRRHPLRSEIVALACIALLLFPVISVSDDLHPGLDVSDDAAWRHEKRGPGTWALIALVLSGLAIGLLRASDPFCFAVASMGRARTGHFHLDLSRGPPRF